MSVELDLPKEYLNWLLKFVSVDHDGVVANSRKAVTDEFNRRHKTNYLVTDLDHWDSVIHWSEKLGMSKEEAKTINHELWYKPDTLLKAEPTPGAIEFLHELYIREVDFIINSSRLPELRASTLEWYNIHAPFIDSSRIHTGIPGFEGLNVKVSRIAELRRRLHLEDVHAHAKAVLENTEAHVILMSNVIDSGIFNNSRLTQVMGEPGEMPDFWPIINLFFN